jgi:hypothetical protein
MAENYLATPGSETTLYLKYFPAKELLEVGFRDSKDVYHYLKVPQAIWKKYKKIILDKGSSGEFLNTVIKNKFAFRKVT